MRAVLSEGAILRVVASLVAAERATIGTGRAWDSAAWDAATSLGPDGLALDSLELLASSEVVARFFRLHEAGDENRLLSEPTLGGWSRIVAEALAGGAIDGFTFATSGTTGRPKLCRQAMVALHEEAQFWSGVFPGCARVVQTVAAHHIYGFLFAVLLPEVTGCPVLDVRMMSPGAVRATLLPTDLLVGFPTGLAGLLRQAADLPRGLRVVSATSSLPADTHRAVRSYGAAQVVDIYGSSETGGIAFRSDPDLPFALLPRWRRGSGEGSIEDISTDAEIALPDRVVWESERLIRPVERIDGAVQVAGVNVFPDRVAARLLNQAMVSACRVTLDSTLPEPRLRAVIVPVPGVDPATAIAACAAWAARHLTAPERPVSFEIG